MGEPEVSQVNKLVLIQVNKLLYFPEQQVLRLVRQSCKAEGLKLTSASLSV